MTTRHLSQRDVVCGETRRMPDGTHAECVSASDTHVGYTYIETGDLLTIRRDVWCSWPVLAEPGTSRSREYNTALSHSAGTTCPSTNWTPREDT